ncbi:MAG: hypothetical protein Q9210_004410 [Variospora velana]
MIALCFSNVSSSSSNDPCPPGQLCNVPVKKLSPYGMVEELRRNHGTVTYRFFFIRDDLHPGIPVFKVDTIVYELEPTSHALNHDDEEDPGCDLFTIISDPTMDPNCDHVVGDDDPNDVSGLEDCGDRIDSFAPDRACVFFMPLASHGRNIASAAKLIPCVFVALGWLSASEAGEYPDLDKRKSYYVVLLNLSTDPISVWLIHDYHSREELECITRWTNGNVGDGNPLFINGDITLTVASDSSPMYLDQYKDFRNRYTNEADMRL